MGTARRDATAIGEGGNVSELGPRKAEILRAVVDEYVATAQPVGSQTVARASRVSVSSATIRNDMVALERDGYLTQPYTSAGRVPTDRAYRYFVDHLLGDDHLTAPERQAVTTFFTSAHRALEDLLHETSQMLATITEHAAVVIGPQPDAAVVRGAQLVELQPGIVLAIAVLSNGAIVRQVIEGAPEADRAQLARAASALAATVEGHALNELPLVGPSGDTVADDLARIARDRIATHSVGAEIMYVGGASRVAAELDAFTTAESAARLLELLEHQVIVVALLRDLLDQGITVRIGAENDLEELRDCSVVLAPYRVEGEPGGTVGVLGPTRMDYRHARAAVAAVSEQLGRSLS